jgi:beta-mannosidase
MTQIKDLGSTSHGWTLLDCDHRAGEGLARRACDPMTSPAGWLPATVPGLVAQDLLAAGRITDPFYGDNVKDARWIENRDWLYRTSFEITKEDSTKPVRLMCESLDTFAAVFLNGELIARHENQFRRLMVDVTGRLRPGENVLVIAFEAPMPATVRRAGPRLAHWNDPWERLYVRKSQMSFGWDWAARTPTVGIVDPIRLEFSDGVWASDLYVSGRPLAGGKGTIRASVDLSLAPGATAGAATAEMLVDGDVVATSEISLGAGTTRVALEHELAHAELWWPKELGTPHLYRVGMRLRRGRHLDFEATQRCGVRDIKLRLRDAASPNGSVFYFEVNGQRLWAKGENWLPLDFLHTRVTPEAYRAYMELLMSGGVNCLRVWGGGIVEHAPFYDLCDELGILLWHDFPYACGVYPKTEAFLEEARLEATDIVERLRSHASLALFCGNNENEVLAIQLSPGDRFHPIYYDVLPKVIGALAPDVPYHAGSPSSPSGKTHPDSMDEGDRHNWDVWFSGKSTDFLDDQARFNSEFGAQAFPQRESLETFMPPGDLWKPGAVSHPDGPSPGYLMARHGAQLEKLISRSASFGPLFNIDNLVATTQAFQAETIGRYIRHYRRLLPITGGVVLWNYTSTWPSICWAAIDFYRRPKQAFYECKRCFRSVVVGIEPADERQETYVAHVSLDRPGKARGIVTLELREIATGNVIGSERGEARLDGPSAVEALRLTLPSGLDRRRHALIATVRHDGGTERDIRYLTRVADLEGLGGTLTAERHGDRVELESTGWRLRVGVESYETPAVWDDDYFDMLPGEKRVLRIEHGTMPAHQWIVADMGTRAPLRLGQKIEL